MTTNKEVPVKIKIPTHCSKPTDRRQQTTGSKSPHGTVCRKIAVIGGRGVGKSSITQYCIYRKKSTTMRLFPPVEYSYRRCFALAKYPKATFDCSIVDTAGYFGKGPAMLSRNACIGVDCYIMVFSVASRASFDEVIQLNGALFETLGDPLDIPRVLVGNMLDKSDR